MANKKKAAKKVPRKAAPKTPPPRAKSPGRKPKKEVLLEQNLRDWCKLMGWECVKVADLGTDGHPDRIIRFGYGRCVYVETKAEEGVLRPAQKNYIRSLLQRGEWVLVTSDFSEACEWIAKCHNYMFHTDIRTQPSDLLLEELLLRVTPEGVLSS